MDDLQKWLKELREKLSKLWEKLEETVVVTNVGGVAKYKSTIHLNGGITHDFPTDKPDKDDIYWKRHNEQVDTVVATKKEILLKILDIINAKTPSIP